MTDEEFAKWLAETLRGCEGDGWQCQFVDDYNLRQTTIDGNFDLVQFAKAIRDKLGRPA